MPGISPRLFSAVGTERTPSPICVFIIRIAVPIQPTCLWEDEVSFWVNERVIVEEGARLARVTGLE
jgi:hypothetical protein